MKQKDKKKRVGIIIIVVFVVVLLLLLIWNFWLQKLYLFTKNESLLEKAGKDYFELNSKKLPNEDNGVSTVSLQTLYKEKWISSVYVPGTDKLCDIKNSWVKVRKEDGVNVYYTYLSCDKYESSVDHIGPEITLNGANTINIDRGTTYQDAGIKSVVDDKDGVLDNSIVKVKVEVDTSKIGNYTVTYTAYDSLRNKTVKTRNIQVVDMLDTVTKKKTGSLDYFKGNISDNYVLFSGMLWRIIGINEDNSIKLITASTVGNMNYNTSTGSFMDSDIKTWLNDYFYNHINKESKKYIVDSSWCNDTIADNELSKSECSSKTEKTKVGLLSIQEFNRSLENGSDTYLQSPYMFWLLNRKDKEASWVNRNDFIFAYDSNFLSFTSTTLLGVRPVINVSDDMAILSGDGTIDNPYRLNDYKVAKKQTKLNTRISGEYVTYSGYLFRIMEVDSDGTTKVVMDQTLQDNNDEILIRYDNGDNDKIYNPKQKGNIGYQVVNKMTTYINTKLFVSKEIGVPVYEKRATFTANRIDKYKVKLSIPNAYEIFSAKNSSTDYSSYWFINSSKVGNLKYVMANAGSPYTQALADYTKAGVKLVAYFNKDVRITGGNGVRSNPYTIEG